MLRHLVGLVAVVLLLAGCVVTEQENIEVKTGSTTEENVSIAKSISTKENLERLKTQLKERFPSLTTNQLDGLELRWNLMTFHAITGKERPPFVSVRVVLRANLGFDPTPVLAAARNIVEQELRSSVEVHEKK